MKVRPYLTKEEVVKRVLKSKKNTVFTTEEQVSVVLEILKRMRVLKTRD